MNEARFEQTETGLKPTTEGWFVVNVRDARWMRHETFGAGCPFGAPEVGFREFGINLRLLEPGQPNGLYHREAHQEDFLVLSGECMLLVEGQERVLRAWDFVHCPPETEHIFIGAGSGPCVIVMVGARAEEEGLFYPVSELARRHGASAERATDSADEAYARFPDRQSGATSQLGPTALGLVHSPHPATGTPATPGDIPARWRTQESFCGSLDETGDRTDAAGMRGHLVSHWRVWLLIVVVVVVVNEVVDRNFFDHREHVDGDFALAVVALIVAFFGSYFVGRRRSRGIA